jgi:hypothetical protein
MLASAPQPLYHGTAVMCSQPQAKAHLADSCNAHSLEHGQRLGADRRPKGVGNVIGTDAKGHENT